MIRVYAAPEDGWLVDLSPDVERVLRWLEELRQRTFVGTESRFLSIVTLLREIAANSSEDPAVRLAYLRGQQADLQAEIDAIEQTGRVRSFSCWKQRWRGRWPSGRCGWSRNVCRQPMCGSACRTRYCRCKPCRAAAGL